LRSGLGSGAVVRLHAAEPVATAARLARTAQGKDGNPGAAIAG